MKLRFVQGEPKFNAFYEHSFQAEFLASLDPFTHSKTYDFIKELEKQVIIPFWMVTMAYSAVVSKNSGEKLESDQELVN